MSVAEDMTIHSLRDAVTPEEWKVRVDLAATYRLVAAYGWDDLIYTHISVRVPGPAPPPLSAALVHMATKEPRRLAACRPPPSLPSSART